MSDRPLRTLSARTRPATPPPPAEREPSLAELFEDPVTLAVMARDGVTLSELQRVVAEAQARLRLRAEPWRARFTTAFEAELFAECGA